MITQARWCTMALAALLVVAGCNASTEAPQPTSRSEPAYDTANDCSELEEVWARGPGEFFDAGTHSSRVYLRAVQMLSAATAQGATTTEIAICEGSVETVEETLVVVRPDMVVSGDQDNE